MVLSSAHYVPIDQDKMGNTTNFVSAVDFRVLTNTPHFDYP